MIKGEREKMTKSEFKTFIKSVPKAELHIHIEAVISLAGVKKMYKNRFGKEMSKEEQVALFSYEDLNGFIQAFLKVQDLFVSEKDFNVVFKELEKYLIRNGIDYCEAFFAPTAFLKKGFSYKKMVDIFHKQIARIKEKSGMTFESHVKKLRLDKAGILLRTTSMKVANVAEAVGYQNVEHFNRLFKAQYGLTPIQYRNQK